MAITYQGEVAKGMRDRGESEASIAAQAERDKGILTPEAFQQYFIGGTPPAPKQKRTAENGFGTGLNLSPDSDYDTMAKDLYDKSQVTRSREDIRAGVLKDYQAEIDALNSYYDNMVSQENARGVDRSGQTRALRAAGGMLGGSPRGNAQQQKTTDLNTELVELVNNKRNVAISNVYREVNKISTEQFDKEIAAKEAGAKEWLSYLKTAQDTKKANAGTILQALLDQGLTPDELSDEEINEIANGLKLSPQAVMTVFQGEYKKLQDAAASQEAKNALELEKLKPADIREYEWAVSNGHFTGTPLEYLKQKGDATRAPRSVGSRNSARDTAGGNEGLSYYANALLGGRLTETSVPQALRVEVNDIVNEIDSYVKSIMGSTDIQISPGEEDVIVQDILDAFSDVGLDEETIRAMVDQSFNTYSSAWNPFSWFMEDDQYKKGTAKRVKK